MSSLVQSLGTLVDLALVILGFTLIIVFHELGHFLACKWAGIRVLAFAVGFGPALVSYRKGLGWRRGSSEPEYLKMREAEVTGINPVDLRAISPTEYRFNILPFGGYVKPLGQDDLNPSASSIEPDSFHAAPVWKRMVMISAGVIMNVIVAAVLFVVVFTIGLKTEPPKVGLVAPDFPAATTVAENASDFGVTEPGLKPGDVILSIDGHAPNSFNDLVLAGVMAERGQPLDVQVERPGVTTDGRALHFRIEPREDPNTRMLAIGIGPKMSGTIVTPKSTAGGAELRRLLDDEDLAALGAGMSLIAVEGRPADSPYDIDYAIQTSDGRPVAATFVGDDTRPVTVELKPRPALQTATFDAGKDRIVPTPHLLGLMPVLRVRAIADAAVADSKLRVGDVFVQIGAIEWPSVPDGISQVRGHKGKAIRVVVERASDNRGDGAGTEVDLGELPVSSGGTLGFFTDTTSRFNTRTAGPVRASPHEADSRDLAAQRLQLSPGSRIVRVEDREVANLLDLSLALKAATRPAFDSGAEETSVKLTVELPIRTASQPPHTETVSWELGRGDLESLHALGWESPLDVSFFQPEQFVLRADGFVGALRMGLDETRRVMLTTYVTFVRLFQQTVKVEHLKGPVGIAHIGTILAERGFVWLLFYLALISVNLAVINFLPIPIADGGHFVYLLYEQVTGKPVSGAVQNTAAIVGVVLLGAIFLIVTFNDIVNVFKG